MRFKKLFAKSILILHICIGSSCVANHSEQVPSTLPDSLHVAVELSNLTLSTSGDTIEGFSFEVLEQICSIKSLPLEYNVFNDIEDLLYSNNDFNIFISNLPITKQVKDTFLVTRPLFTDRQVLVQNKNTANKHLITSPEQLAGDTVWIPQRFAIMQRLENLQREMGTEFLIIERDDLTEEQLIILIALGEISRGVASEYIALNLLKEYPNLDISTGLSFSQYRSWILNPGDSILCDSLNSWLDEFMKTKQFEELRIKHGISLK